MNILFLCNEYPPRPHGGIGTSVHQLAHRLVAEGHRVWVLGWGREAARYDDRGVTVEVLAETRVPKLGWWRNRRACARRIVALDRRHGLDLVEGPDWCGMAAWQSLPVPYVVRLNGSDSYFGRVLDLPVRPAVRRAEASNLRRADAIVSVSRFCWRVTRELFALRGEAAIIPNGVDCARFRPAPAAAVEADTVLYLGTLVRKKGVFELLRAFETVVAERPAARLWLAGRDSVDRATGVSTVAALERSVTPATWARVRHLGAIPYAEVPALLARSAACCFPSFAEALPMTWIEAMACGKALVASNHGPGPEVAVDGEEALLVDPRDRRALADALLALLGNAELAAGLGRRARARCERTFAAEVVAEQNLAFYARVLEGGRSRR